MTATVTVRRKRGRPTPANATNLDGGLIISKLLEMVTRDGIETITMRGLAHELGVSPRLLYAHVRDQQEMLELLTDAILAKHMPDLSSDDWELRLRNIADSNRAAFAPHRGLAALLLQRSVGAISQPSSSTMQNAIRKALQDAGLSREFVDLFYLQFVVLVLGNIIITERLEPAAQVEGDRETALRSQRLGLDVLFASVRAVRNSEDALEQPPECAKS